MIGKRASGEEKNKEGNWDGALGLNYGEATPTE